MIDAANYREVTQQFEALKNELECYSEELAKLPYAVALTRIDAITVEEANEKMKEFLDALKLQPNNGLNKYSADENYLGYMSNEKVNPLFVMSISSVSKVNIQPLIFALADIIGK
jgi:GTP-binding protein